MFLLTQELGVNQSNSGARFKTNTREWLLTQRAVNVQNTKSFGKEATEGIISVQGKVREILGRDPVKSD